MDIKKISLPLILIVSLLINKNGNCQCETCSQNHRPMDQTEVMQLNTNYKRNYHKNAEETKKHSVSVDFSSEAVINFYEKVFLDQKKYMGVNIYPICFNKRMSDLPKHVHKKQIGLMIVAADSNCKSNFGEFSIHNNSFNQSASHYDHSNGTHYCGPTEVEEYTKNYKTNFPDSQYHTTYIHYAADIISVFYGILKANTNYKGIRFYFTSYNESDQTCGQATDEQITVTIVTVDQDGKDNYNAFKNYLTQSDFFKDKIDKLLIALNHGSLCPNYCPR